MNRGGCPMDSISPPSSGGSSVSCRREPEPSGEREQGCERQRAHSGWRATTEIPRMNGFPNASPIQPRRALPPPARRNVMERKSERKARAANASRPPANRIARAGRCAKLPAVRHKNPLAAAIALLLACASPAHPTGPSAQPAAQPAATAAAAESAAQRRTARRAGRTGGALPRRAARPGAGGVDPADPDRRSGAFSRSAQAQSAGRAHGILGGQPSSRSSTTPK